MIINFQVKKYKYDKVFQVNLGSSLNIVIFQFRASESDLFSWEFAAFVRKRILIRLYLKLTWFPNSKFLCVLGILLCNLRSWVVSTAPYLIFIFSPHLLYCNFLKENILSCFLLFKKCCKSSLFTVTIPWHEALLLNQLFCFITGI